jgi:hypothetical protein
MTRPSLEQLKQAKEIARNFIVPEFDSPIGPGFALAILAAELEHVEGDLAEAIEALRHEQEHGRNCRCRECFIG